MTRWLLLVLALSAGNAAATELKRWDGGAPPALELEDLQGRMHRLADYRGKVVLEEPPGNLAMKDAKVEAARRRLFGSWEMNWLAYNMGHDVKLPKSRGPTLPYLMYINAEADGEMRDQLDPESVKYTITARELGA